MGNSSYFFVIVSKPYFRVYWVIDKQKFYFKFYSKSTQIKLIKFLEIQTQNMVMFKYGVFSQSFFMVLYVLFS